MTTFTYAGIGSRATPVGVLQDMTVMAGWLARTGWNLASGGADGADTAFARGAPAGQRTLYLPWRGYNGHGGPGCRALTSDELSACMALAARLHPTHGIAVRRAHGSCTLGISRFCFSLPSTVPSMLSLRSRPRGAISRAGRAWASASPPSVAFPC